MDNPEKTDGAMKNGQSRENGNIGYARRRKTKQKHSALDTTHTEANTNNATGGKDERSQCRNRNRHHNT